jgi:outer membrane protein assembly factor BamB
MRKTHVLALTLALLTAPAVSWADVPVELIWETPSYGHHVRCVSAIEDQEGFVPADQDVLVEIDYTGDPAGHLKLLRGADGEVLWGFSPPGGVSGGCGYGDMCLTSVPDLNGDGMHEALLGTSWGGRTAYALLANDGGRIFWDFDTYADDPPSGWVYSIDWIDDVTGDGIPEVIFGCGSDNNNAYCVDGATGALRWTFAAPDAVYQVARIGDVNGNGTDDVLIGTGDSYADYTYCVDGGSIGYPSYIWRFYVGASTFSVAGTDDVNDDGVPDALVGTWDPSGTVYCVSGADGSEIWSYPVGSYQYVMRVIPIKDLNDDGPADVLVGSWDNAIIALNGRTGAELWNVPTGTTNGGDVWTIWPMGDVDYDGYADVIAGSFDLKAYCVSGRTGDILWDYTVGNRVYTVRSIFDVNSDQVRDALVGTQYYGGVGGKVYCLDADGDVTGVPPVAELSCGIDGEAVVLSWVFNEEAGLAGFNVYRMVVDEVETSAALRQRLMERGTFSVREALAERAGLGVAGEERGSGFVRLNGELVQGCSYSDASAVDGTRYSYMIGAVNEDGSEVLTGPVEVLADFRVNTLWLAHAAPNPFRISASLEFAVPAGAGAELGIYTPAGRLVRRLAAGGGGGTAVWDGRSDEGERVATGVYLVRLKAAGKSAHRKVVLLR